MRAINKISATLFAIAGVISVMKLSNYRSNMMAIESLQEGPAMLTLFTTFKEIKIVGHHKFAQKLVLTNWPLFRPYVRPVLFLNYTNSKMARRARAAGWDVLRINRSNSAGTPYLKDMYMTAFQRYDSAFYGFANGDLLFDDGLLKTLEAVKRGATGLDNNIMITGRRTDVLVNLTDSRWTRDSFTVDKLHTVAIRNGSLIPAWAIDYFFFSKEGCSMNWSSLIDIVIGRPAYDSYFVAMARRSGVNVIDCTKTLLAVHISQKGILSHGRLNPDSSFNARLIGNFRHAEGYPTSAKLATAVDFQGNIFVIRRR